MPWYYVLPQTLLLVAAVATALAALARVSTRRRWLGPLLAVVAFAILMPDQVANTVERARGTVSWIHKTEPERAAVGAFVRDHAEPGDRLYTGHGYIARTAGLYVYDYSGLNSPVVTDLRSEGKSPLLALAPQWSVRPGLWPPEFQRAERYELQASFYGRCLEGRQSWRVFRRVAPDAPLSVAVPLTIEDVTTDGQVQRRGDAVHIQADRWAALRHGGRRPVRALRTGIARAPRARRLFAWLLVAGHADRPLGEVTVPAREPDDLAAGRTAEITLALPADLPPEAEPVVRLECDEGDEGDEGDAAVGFRLFEPVWIE